MKSRDFCFWLQGYLELVSDESGNAAGMTLKQVDCMRKHLSLVFKHEIDPSFPDSDALNELHKPGPPHGDLIMRC